MTRKAIEDPLDRSKRLGEIIAKDTSPTPTRGYEAEAERQIRNEWGIQGELSNHEKAMVANRAALLRLQDENAELRVKLRSAEAANAVGNVAIDFVDKFREAVISERKSVCYWCGHGEETPEELKKHALECDKHPLMAELTSLRKKGELYDLLESEGAKELGLSIRQSVFGVFHVKQSGSLKASEGMKFPDLPAAISHIKELIAQLMQGKKE